MFERFTERARRAVVLAQEEARQLDHNYIGTEHLLLGLLREDDGLAAKTLNSLGLSMETVQAEIGSRIGRGSTGPKGHIPFTPRAKKVLELALREALRLRHNYIGTEHILLGLIREGEGIAAQIVMSRVDGGLERIRDTLVGLLGPGVADVRKAGPGEQLRARVLRATHGPADVTIGISDEVRQRLEAIEARLSVIERLLREQRGEEEVS